MNRLENKGKEIFAAAYADMRDKFGVKLNYHVEPDVDNRFALRKWLPKSWMKQPIKEGFQPRDFDDTHDDKSLISYLDDQLNKSFLSVFSDAQPDIKSSSKRSMTPSETPSKKEKD